MTFGIGCARGGRARGARSTGGSPRAPWMATALWVATTLAFVSNASAGPYVWDQDENGIDDRMETVQVLGFRFSFEKADTLLRQRFQVVSEAGSLAYGMYVVYDHPPTDSDAVALSLVGLPQLQRLVAVPAIHTFGTFAQAQLARNLAGVERIEVVPILYPGLVDGAAAIGARDASERVFPTLATTAGGPDGHGIVVAIVDTGVNDAVDGGYPGHESVIGRCLGGASVLTGNSASDTPHGQSVNPKDHGGLSTHAHATHVAGIVLGSGGATGAVKGIAPGAKYIDVKALDDTGNGHAVAEAIDWCIANRNRNWGDLDASFQGIDVINLSLSSLDASDGNDVASRAAARAVELGIVVVASMGNEGGSGVPSPAAGDGVIAVNAWDDQRSGLPGDDLEPEFNPQGPRASDGDLVATDELKPTLVAPGVATLSADGDPSTDGAQYRRASGTSAAAAFVSGAVALLKSANPAATPAQIANLLVSTARRSGLGAPATLPGLDPRWSARVGYGVLDVHAARLEQTQPARTQIRRLALVTDPSGVALDVTLETMRERGTSWLAFERAPDVGGAPGAFAGVDSVAAAGDSSLADSTDVTSYPRTWSIPNAERGQTFWYRAAYTEAGVRYVTPARAFASPSGPPAATAEIVIVHNAYDNDVDAVVEAAGAVDGPVVVRSFPVPGSSAAASFDWVSGVSATGNIALTFKVPISAEQAAGMLPPSASTPWTLRVGEAGFLNRSGRVTSFRLIQHTGGGDVIYEGVPAPAQTFEGQETAVRIPAATVAVEPGLGARVAHWPNPVPAGESVTFVSERAAPEGVEIFDLSGRRIGRATLHAAGATGAIAHWSARDAAGKPLAAGMYFARVGGPRAPAMRVVVLP